MNFAIECRLLDELQHVDDTKYAAANRVEELHSRNARLRSELVHTRACIDSAKSVVWQEVFPRRSDGDTFERIWMLVRAYEDSRRQGEIGGGDDGSDGTDGSDGDDETIGTNGANRTDGTGGTNRTEWTDGNYRNDVTDETEEDEEVIIL